MWNRPQKLILWRSTIALSCRGFMDLHVHGWAGLDVMQSEQTGRSRFQKFLGEHGVTAYCPTTVTAPLDTTLAALERLADSIEKQTDRTGAQPIGIHLEGPFLS